LLAAASRGEGPPAHFENPDGDVHLRSFIQGVDEASGHVDDFIVDDETWEVRYLVVETSDWWCGKRVLVAPRWARHG
jgi:hypothetical protein